MLKEPERSMQFILFGLDQHYTTEEMKDLVETAYQPDDPDMTWLNLDTQYLLLKLREIYTEEGEMDELLEETTISGNAKVTHRNLSSTLWAKGQLDR